jgi:hypothetical protein
MLHDRQHIELSGDVVYTLDLGNDLDPEDEPGDEPGELPAPHSNGARMQP